MTTRPTPEAAEIAKRERTAHERRLAAEAEAATRVVSGGVEVRVHRVDAHGEERVIVRLVRDGAVLHQVSAPADSVTALGSAVYSLLTSAKALGVARR